MKIPDFVKNVLQTMEDAGYEAWCVGGAVRDMLSSLEPQDWDVATSARPGAVLALFGDDAIPTGLRHGTVTVLSEGNRIEVTTYRTDGTYTDHRRPDSVAFVTSLEEDLRRRDFTINAMALDLRGTLRDPFGGRKDLERGILRCVGESDARFDEDALRILRALRFAAARSLRIEPATAQSIHRKCRLLETVAPERIWSEFIRLICGENAAAVLREFPDVIGVFAPELAAMVGFEQCNVHHCYDVWEHSLHAMEQVPADPVLRCAVLFHDVGKPKCFTVGEDGVGHFYGHGAIGKELTDAFLRRMRCAAEFRETVVTLVDWHDRNIPRTDKAIRRALRSLGEENLRRLVWIKRADNLAQAPEYRGRQAELDEAEEIMDRLLAEDACFSLRHLAVNGRDMLALGLEGPAVGAMLERLLDDVVDGALPNDRDALLSAARERSGR